MELAGLTGLYYLLGLGWLVAAGLLLGVGLLPQGWQDRLRDWVCGPPTLDEPDWEARRRLERVMGQRVHRVDDREDLPAGLR